MWMVEIELRSLNSIHIYLSLSLSLSIYLSLSLSDLVLKKFDRELKFNFQK